MIHRFSLALVLICPVSCDEEPKPRAAEIQPSRPAPPSVPPAASPRTAPAPARTGEDAAAALRHYYALIEAGRYDAAWRMRSGSGQGADRLAANFAAYETYRAAVGTPGPAADAKGWRYVDVPVMITGSFKDGKPFASSGSITLRRAVSADGATPAERDWHIYTG